MHKLESRAFRNDVMMKHYHSIYHMALSIAVVIKWRTAVLKSTFKVDFFFERETRKWKQRYIWMYYNEVWHKVILLEIFSSCKIICGCRWLITLYSVIENLLEKEQNPLLNSWAQASCFICCSLMTTMMLASICSQLWIGLGWSTSAPLLPILEAARLPTWLLWIDHGFVSLSSYYY